MIAQTPADNLICRSDALVTLNANCEAVLLISNVLSGEFDGLTAADFTLTVVDDNPDNGPIVDGCGDFQYVVEIVPGVAANFTTCWGNLTAEDKTNPTVSCSDVSQAVIDGNSYDLICTDIDEILLTGTEAYVVNGDGSLIAGTMSDELQTKLGYTGFPEIRDNCGQVLVNVWDEVVQGGDCDQTIINRHFEVSDQYNSTCNGVALTASCVQHITFRKADLADINNPDALVEIACDAYFEMNENGYPSPSFTGFLTVQTAFGRHDIDEAYCNIGATYSDSDQVDVCENTYKIVRTWEMVNWCDPSPPIIYTQTIKVGDFEAPGVTCLEEDVDWDGTPDTPIYSTGAYECTASFVVPLPEITDNCSSDFEVLTQIFSEADGQGMLLEMIGPNDQNRFVSGIEKGCYFFRYTVTDACGNTTVADCPFIVEDQVAPVASCDDQLNISIGNTGSRVYVEDVNEGSHDNCSDNIKMELRRSYSDGSWSNWGAYIDFDCNDVHDFVTIELRVWDDENMDGIPGNHATVNYCDGSSMVITDNSNKCWMEIQVEDEIAPSCDAPHAQTLHCDDETALHLVQNLNNESWMNEHFGEGAATDNCSAIAEQSGFINGLTDCGWGTITRQFQAIDEWGLVSTNVCNQVITIYDVHDYEIKFPKDVSIECGIPHPDTIETYANACDLFAINVYDERYDVSYPDACYAITRRYRVINWCEYDGESAPIVIGRDEDGDGNPGDEDVVVIVRTEWTDATTSVLNAYIDADRDETNGYWRTTNSVGHWEYSQLIKVTDTVPPSAEIAPDADVIFCSYDPAGCTGEVSIAFTTEDFCSWQDLTPRGYIDEFNTGDIDGTVPITGMYPNFTISGNYPLGEHRFAIEVTDGCENKVWLEIVFKVVDCVAPAPICISGLAVELIPVPGGSSVDVWATDFIASAISDCSGIKGYSIHKESDIESGADVPAYPHPSIELGCDDDVTTVVRVYAWDNADNPYAVQPDGSVGGANYDYCQTLAHLQGWEDACDGEGFSVAGRIQTEESYAVEGVAVSLTGNESMSSATTGDGGYAFHGINAGSDITITPNHEANPLNHVTSFDIVLISKHILNIQLLDSPYKLIAADVNNSHSITALDIIAMRRLILGISTEFENAPSWRFIDAAYVFPDPTNPWSADFPEVISINNISADELHADFVAIKMGNVSGI